MFIKDEKIFKEEETIEILKTLGLINKREEYQMNIKFFWRTEIDEGFKSKKIDDAKSSLIEEIKQNELMRTKAKRFVGV